jgi:hypothetical protein
VQPIALGVPIFTPGDNIWLESYYNSTIVVALQTPSGLDVTGEVPVEPGQLSLLYSLKGLFSLNGNPYTGQWRLSVVSPFGISNATILVVPPDDSLKPAYAGAQLNRNELNQTFTLPSTDAYDIQICSVGQSVSHAYGFSVAGGLNGSVGISLAGSSSNVTATGITSPLSIWLELYSQYSYQTGGGGIASRNLLVATTPVLEATPPTASLQGQLLQQMPIRQGRFDVRIFDRTSAGLALHDAQFLRTANGTWVQLGGCTSQAKAYTAQLSLTTDLDSANSTWPRQLLTMYSMIGMESYTEVGIPGSEAAFHIRDFPDGKPLTGVGITPSAPGLIPSEWDVTNSSVYLLTTSLPGAIAVRLSFSGVALDTLNVSIPGPYSSKSLAVDAGTLDVSASQSGKTLPNSTMSVATAGSQPVVVKQAPLGGASLLLPPGNYTVSATYGGVSSSRGVVVTPGHISSVSLDLTQQPVPVALYLLIAAGIGGIIANIFLWRQYLERRKTFG